MRVLSDEQIERIEDASFQILEQVGIEFLSDEALRLWHEAGADVNFETQRVHMDRALIKALIKTAPEQFTMHARNPAHNLIMGGGYMIFSMVSGPGYAYDIKRGRRTGSFADYLNYVKLAQSFDVIHNIGGFIVENQDTHEDVRHLQLYQAQHVYSDKCTNPSARGFNHANDAVEIAAMVFAADGGRDWMLTHPVTLSVVNSNSPLRYDTPMLEGLITYARAGQCVIVTPFTLAGAMAPITVVGALAQQNAEALAGIALTQLVRPGAPVVYGGFTSNVDMQSGSPAFGTPEGALATIAGGQLARRYHVPYRSSNVASSKAPDAQAAYESMMALWPVVLSHANYILHAAGWLDGGLSAGLEKVIIDVEMLQMLDAFTRGLTVDDGSLALDAIADVGPGGHFFGTPHTMERYRTEFYRPLISDLQNYDNWFDGGALTAADRAYQKAHEVIAAYTQPALDPSIAEAIEAYVARRTREILRQNA
jgi:trimethylamine--corrinoid protein Co-methyltransferase